MADRGRGYRDRGRGGRGGPSQGYGARGGFDSSAGRGARGGSDRGSLATRGDRGRGRGGPAQVEIFSHGPGDAAYVDTKIQAVEDNLQKSYKSKGISESQYPHRPGYGTRGKAITLWANYFELAPGKNLVLHRYKVDVVSGKGDAKPTGGKLKRIIQLLLQDHFGGSPDITTDYKATLISKSALTIPQQSLLVRYRLENEDEPDEDSRTYRLRVTDAGTVTVSELMDYLTSTNVSTVYAGKDETIQALNIMLGYYPKSISSVASVGANRHFAIDQAAEKWNLGAGLEVLRGYFVSVRAAAARILVNIQVKHAACYEVSRLDRLMASYTMANRLDLSKQSDRQRLDNFLKRVRVNPFHFTKKNKAGQTILRVKTIAGLATDRDGQGSPYPPIVPRFGAGSREVKFFLKGTPGSSGEGSSSKPGGTGGGQKGKKSGGKTGGKPGEPSGKKPGPDLPSNEYISVYDFFQRRYNITIQNPNLPVVNVGNKQNPTYLPPEVCDVLPGQPSNSRLSPAQTQQMIRFAVRKPAQNATSIVTNGARVLGVLPQLNTTLQNFDVSVTPRMITVPGRVLTGPPVQYRSKKTANTRFGSWNMQSIQFTVGTNLPSWSYLWISIRGTPDHWQNEDQLKQSLQSFHGALNTNGVSASIPILPGFRLTLEGDSGDDAAIESTLDKIMDHARKPKLMLVILPKVDTAIYNRIKFMGDVKKGIHTICVTGPKFGKQTHDNNAQYFANVALKFNLKLGGVNQSLDASKLGLISEGKTMVVGIDVTHPSPGSASTAPSVAGIVASVDKNLGQWPADVRIQTARQEMVSGLDHMLRLRLELWREKNKTLPENILVYRDGVSEGQYRVVLEEELPLLRKACSALYSPDEQKKGLPNISIIVVGKRHHTRFYPTKAEDADRSSNPQNGTVVDRGVTEPRNWDFFLQAHTAIQGTARPAHYFIVIDEIFRKRKVQAPFQSAADALEDLTHNMCYLFGRATKAVSICPPAYYADLVCERARCYLSGIFDATPMATPSTSVAGSAQGPVADANDVVIHPNLKNMMFYI